ncbi:hypothetical protein ABG768_018629, partial [Culter alburnus]
MNLSRSFTLQLHVVLLLFSSYIYISKLLLEGVWTLYKALNVVAYTGFCLIETAGGKGCLCVMPVQNTPDISPSPHSPTETEEKLDVSGDVSQTCLFSCWLHTSRS